MTDYFFADENNKVTDRDNFRICGYRKNVA